MTIHFFLPVIPVTKKNHQQILINRRTGARFVSQSETYKKFERDCLMLIPGEVRNAGIDKPCVVTTVFYVPTHRRVDLVNCLSAIHDVLVKGGVLADDNSNIIYSVDGSRVQYRPEQPGIDVIIRGE